MKLTAKISVGLMLVLCASVAIGKPKPTPKPDIKALLVTGGCCHDYDTQREIIPRIINTHTGLRVQWTVLHQLTDASDVKLDFYMNPNWAKGYDVVVHNECFANIGDEKYIDGILKPHLEGVPAVLIHCAMHSYRAGPTAEKWWEFCGLHSPGHGPKHPFEVQVLKQEHEVMKGLANWKTPQGELYFINKTYPTMTALAESKSNKTGEMHVNIWVNAYGPQKTRVFGTTIGHHNETMNHGPYMEMLTRGFLWAAGHSVADHLKHLK